MSVAERRRDHVRDLDDTIGMRLHEPSLDVDTLFKCFESHALSWDADCRLPIISCQTNRHETAVLFLENGRLCADAR